MSRIVATPATTGHSETAGRSFKLDPLVRAIPVGQTLVLYLGTSAGTAQPTMTVTDSVGNRWQRDGIAWTGPTVIAAVFSAPITVPLPAGAVITVALAGTDLAINRWDGVVKEVTGLAQVSYQDVSAVASANTMYPTVNLPATANGDELLVGCFACASAPVFTPDRGIPVGPVKSTAGTADKQVAGLIQELSTAGPQTVSGTLSSSTIWQGVAVAYKFAAAAAPTARLTVSPKSGDLPLQVGFDASASTDPQGLALTFTFDYGDGSSRPDGSAATGQHTYQAAGTYTATVTATNSQGMSASKSSTVVVTVPTGPSGGQASMIVTPVATAHVDAAARKITLTTVRQVAAGRTLLLGLGCTSLLAPNTSTFTATDSAGNTWPLDATYNYQPSIQSAVLSLSVTTMLPAGTVITGQVPAAESMLARWTGIVMEAVGVAAGAGRVDQIVTGTSAAAIVTLTTPACLAGDLIVGMLTAGAAPVFTPDAGVSVTTPVASAGGSGDKQGILLYKVAGTAGPQTLSGRWDSATQWTLAVVAYKAAAPSSGGPAVGVAARYVARGGALYPIVSKTARNGVLV